MSFGFIATCVKRVSRTFWSYYNIVKIATRAWVTRVSWAFGHIIKLSKNAAIENLLPETDDKFILCPSMQHLAQNIMISRNDKSIEEMAHVTIMKV